MTAPVLDRHRRAALDAFWGRSGRSTEKWVTTGDISAFSCYDDDIALIATGAQAIADAEERGRMEERVRCLRAVFAPALNLPSAAAYNTMVATAERIAGAPVQDGDWEDPSVLAQRGLDAARKELGE